MTIGTPFSGDPRVSGHWYDGTTSRQQTAHLSIDPQGCVRVEVEGRMLPACPLSALEISARLGNTPRAIIFPDGGRFETRDNERIDQWLARWQPSPWAWVHHWESAWQYVLASVVLIGLLAWWVIVEGLPMAADKIADVLPESVGEMLGEQSMQILDEYYFKPSRLPETDKQRVQTHFQRALDSFPELKLRVQFRDGGLIGANAFALPDGSIVFTDQIVALAAHDDELLAILAHEIGHVAEQHSLRMVVRNSLLGFLLLAVSGDATLSSDLLLAAPLFMLEMSHSRQYEASADDFALAWLRLNAVRPDHFTNLLARIEQSEPCLPDLPAGKEKEDDEAKEGEEKTELPYDLSCYQALARGEKIAPDAEEKGSEPHKIWSYLSSHPQTEERLRRFREE